MRFGTVLSDSWKALWRSWALWGLVAIWMALTAVLLVVAAVAFSSLLLTALDGMSPDPVRVALFSAIAGLMGLALVPLYWFVHAAAIHMSNEALAGITPRLADGLAAGRRRIGSLAGFELALWAVLVVAGGVLAVLVGVVFGGTLAATASNDSLGSFGAFMSVFCCMYAVLIFLSLVASVFIMAFEAVGARAAVLSGRSGLEAFKDAWSALRSSFKKMLVMGLIMLGVTWGYSFMSSIVLTPLQLVFYPQMSMMDPDAMMETADLTAFMGTFGLFWIVYMLASFAITFPLTIYMYLAWTAFYRQLVGIASAEETPAPQYEQDGMTVQAQDSGALPPPPAPPAGSSALPPPPAPPGTLPPPPDSGSSGDLQP